MFVHSSVLVAYERRERKLYSARSTTELGERKPRMLTTEITTGRGSEGCVGRDRMYEVRAKIAASAKMSKPPVAGRKLLVW